MSKTSKSAAVEFESGRILWTEDGLPIDARKPVTLGECVVLGCSAPREPKASSGFCRFHLGLDDESPDPTLN